MSLVLRWILPAVLGIVAGWIASLFSNSCPGDAASFVCQHWATIAGAVAAVMAALGHPFTPWGKKVATNASMIASARSAVTSPPAPEPETPVRLVPADELDAEAQAEIEKLRGPG